MPATALQNTLVDDAAAEEPMVVEDAPTPAREAAPTAADAARIAADKAVVASSGRSHRAPHLRAVEPLREPSDRDRAIAAHPSSRRSWDSDARPMLRAVEDMAGSALTQAAEPHTQAEAPGTEPGSPTAIAPVPEVAPVERAGRMDDPEQLCAALALCVVEIIAGARPLDQVAYWVTDAVYVHLLRRTVIAARARAVAAEEPMRPRVRIGAPHLFEPREGVVEAVVMVHQTPRSRAMTIRLERHRSRWRATALSML
ncbi:Rv3235 family protein [Leifsonia sp. F6_8S_P_1B]|uniref:Rv3235 family protein n=1 Tax=Leifsonia williamsii TaxID=3035919 RepID=A0ABT8KDB3_9MICO|nr:Rv3235 family protein [Leifsonia williamsii]MDN4614462.1 Rv3235 family protein [Leifsonia williamsii]